MPSYHWLHFSAALCTIQCHSPALRAILALFVPQRSIVNHPITGCTAMQSCMPLLPGPQHSLARHPAPPLSVCCPAILPLVVPLHTLVLQPTTGSATVQPSVPPTTSCTVQCHCSALHATCCPVAHPCPPFYHWFRCSAALCAILLCHSHARHPLCHIAALYTILRLVMLQCSHARHLFVPQCRLAHHPISGRTAGQLCAVSKHCYSVLRHDTAKCAMLLLVVTECSLSCHPTACCSM